MAVGEGMKKVLVPLDDLRVLFDTAVGSMDFGSGFLDDAEVKVLRNFAEKIGLDPMQATPTNFRKRFFHKFKADLTHWEDIEGNFYSLMSEEDAQKAAEERAVEALRQAELDKYHNDEMAKLGYIFNDPLKPRRLAEQIEPAELKLETTPEVYRVCEWCDLPEKNGLHEEGL